MIKVAVFTTTRGDMAILAPLLLRMKKDKKIKPLLFVGGTHLDKNYGKTINEIESCKIRVNGVFRYETNRYSRGSLIESLSNAHLSIRKIFQKNNFDFVCILGDRFEKLAIVNNAIIFNKPIIHLFGGEKSEGVIDEQIRHMITKASHLHFVMSEVYKKNIISMGEQKFRVFNTGNSAIDSIKNIKKISYEKILKKLNLDYRKKFVILTYHPVTLKKRVSTGKQIKNILSSLKKFDLQIIITFPGHEHESNIIKKILKKEVNKNKNYVLVKSLGFENLFNLLPKCSFVIGNSSSGITETPYFKIPTINIGERQKGRFFHDSVINCRYSKNEILKSIKKALSKNFLKKIKKTKYQFGNGNSSEKMIKVLKSIKINEKFLRKQLINNIF